VAQATDFHPRGQSTVLLDSLRSGPRPGTRPNEKKLTHLLIKFPQELICSGFNQTLSSFYLVLIDLFVLFVYNYRVPCFNKSVLNWTFCQLLK